MQQTGYFRGSLTRSELNPAVSIKLTAGVKSPYIRGLRVNPAVSIKLTAGLYKSLNINSGTAFL